MTEKENIQGIHDVPASEGVRNVIRRAYQGAYLTYTPVTTLPNIKEDVPAGTTVRGIAYSSVRREALYVPNCASLDSYMSAMRNPNSYLYTRVSTTPNSRGYMGTVCSAFVSWSLNLPCVYTTHQLASLEDVEAVRDQSVQGLTLGAMILHTSDHVSIVTDVVRDEAGKVIAAEISESVHPRVRSKFWTPQEITEKLLNKGYGIYRYKHIDSVPYTPSPRVPLPGETLPEPWVNPCLAPRRGDKANWRLGEPVEIDVTDGAGFTKAKLYKDETCVSVTDLPADGVLRYDGLGYGSYRVCLTDGARDSEPVYFIVTGASITAEDLGGGRARIRFSSPNARPGWYAWCFTSGRDEWAVKRAFPLTEAEKEAGEVITAYEPGFWRFKVEFFTEYGGYSSDMAEAVIS